jgi:Tfp pilus assembly protein PilF
MNFIRRRRGYAYIDFNQLDQAEKIFTQMLDEEENADYAINELAYIKKLRQQRGEDVTADAGNASDDGNDQAQGK